MDYRLAVNEPFSTNTAQAIAINQSNYNPANTKKAYAGYFMYQFLEQESNVLPYLVGSYLGTKKVFNLGADFHYNQNGMWHQATDLSTQYSDIALFAIDAFLDLPLHETKNDAITAYLVYYNYDFGPNHIRNIGIMNPANGSTSNPGLSGNALPILGTGSIGYAQLGYVLPHFTNKVRIQPYAAGAYAQYEGLQNSTGKKVPLQILDIGTNFYLEGQHSKLTLNYRSRPDFTNPDNIIYRPEITLQAMVYL